MQNTLKLTLSLLSVGCFSQAAFADRVAIDGIYYQLDETAKTATVVAPVTGETRYTGEVTIPSVVGEGYTVVGIDVDAFSNASITSVVLPETLESIGERGFFNCEHLANVSFPASLQSIGDYAFQACKAFTEVTIPASVSYLGRSAFWACRSVASVDIQSDKISELVSTFEDCWKLSSVKLPATISRFDSAFRQCYALSSIQLPAGLKQIDYMSFAETNIEKLLLPDGVTDITGMALGTMNGDWNSNKILKTVYLPGSLKKIEYSAFNNDCALADLTIDAAESALVVTGNSYYAPKLLSTPDDIKGVAPLTDLVLRRDIQDEYGNMLTSAIFGCKTTLENVTFGGSITATPSLTDCHDIISVTMESAVPPVCGGFAQEVYENAVLKIPADAYEAYSQADGWKDFAMFAAKPSIAVEGADPEGVIEIDNMGIFVLKFSNAESGEAVAKCNLEIEDESVATIYASINSLVAHREGETKVTFSVADGSLAPTEYTIRVKGVDPSDRPDNFIDGMVWLNEEWFGHTSGSLNYIDTDGTIYYRAYANQNDNKAFGATSQFATNYAGKYIVISKQAWDNGDTRPVKSGGRVVVFDDQTFKYIGSVDNIGGDGRACVGVDPSKMYLSTTSGIRVLNLDDISVADADIAGLELGRNAQLGDMVKAGKYVFATLVGTGVIVIDTTDDSYVKTINLSGIQTLAQSADGRVWLGCAKSLTPLDPETLELGETVTTPGSITCSSYSWRHGNLIALHNSNELIWGSGTFYRWNLDTEETPSQDAVFTHVSKDGDVTYGSAYGAPGYDEESDTYMFATMAGFGINAIKNWIHYIDASTGEVKHRQYMKEYFWFPAMPVNPDRYDAEFALEDTIDMEGSSIEDIEPVMIDLSEMVSDRDNHDCNISFAIEDESDAVDEDEELPAIQAADLKLEGKVLTVTPVCGGTRKFTLVAESNGRVVKKSLTANVKIVSGVDAVSSETGVYRIYTLDGLCLGETCSASSEAVKAAGMERGVYMLRASNGTAVKVVVK